MLPGLDAQDAKCISLQNSHVGQPFGWKWDWLTRRSQAQMLRVGPVEMHQHDAADMEEKSESLQRMKIIWAAFLWVFSAKMQSKQCSACASVATSHDVLRARPMQMGNEAKGMRMPATHGNCHGGEATPRRVRPQPHQGRLRSTPLVTICNSRVNTPKKMTRGAEGPAVARW